MVYGTGGVSSFLTGLLASSTSRLYSSSGSVTLPEAGTGGSATSSAAATKPGKSNIHANNIDKIFFICHLPFSRADTLVPQEGTDFRLVVRRPDREKGRTRGKKRGWEESRRASLPTSRSWIYREVPQLPLESAWILFRP